MTRSIAPALLAALVAIACGRTSGAEAPDREAPVKSESPREVFEALRAAYREEDWQAVFSCISGNVQDEIVYEGFLTCVLHFTHTDDAVTKLLKKYRIDPDAVDAEFRRKLEQMREDESGRKNVHEQAETSAKVGARLNWRARNPADGNPHSERLLREIVLRRVRNKPGFVAEVHRQFLQDLHGEDFCEEIRDLRSNGGRCDGIYRGRVRSLYR